MKMPPGFFPGMIEFCRRPDNKADDCFPTKGETEFSLSLPGSL
jgi:hypothetical protein